MNKKLFSIITVVTLFLLFQSFKNSKTTSEYYSAKNSHHNILNRSSGAAANGLGDLTGSPSSSGTCASCHNGGSYSPSITLNITNNLGNQITSYVAGVEYNLSFTITNSNGTPGGYGMQATALFANNTAAGTFSAPSSNAQITPESGRSYFEHNIRSTTSTFTSKWTAPATGNGAVTFYFVGNVVDGTGGTSGDQSTAATTRTLIETLSISDFDFQKNIKLEQNPVKDILKINLTDNYQIIDLEIFDISGKSIFNKKYTNVSIINEKVNFSTGVYYLKFNNEYNSKASLRFVKE
jgi:hypothetical protein